jgi:hypothetical protein
MTNTTLARTDRHDRHMDNGVLVEAGGQGIVARIPTRDGVLILKRLSPDEAAEADAGRRWVGKVDLRPYQSILREASGGEWLALDPDAAGISALALRKRIHLSAKALKLDVQWARPKKGEPRVWFRLA